MFSDKPWKLESLLFLAAGIMVSIALSGVVGAGLNNLLPDLPAAQKPYIDFLLTLLGFHGAILVFTGIFLKQHDTSWARFLGLGYFAPKKILLASLASLALVLPVALGLNLLSAWLMSLFGFEPVEQASVQLLQSSEHWDHLLLFGFAAIVMAPICEEILFRGLLYPFLKQRFPVAFALWMSSILFATIHANAMTFVPLTVFALILVRLYERTQTLVAPIITHALFNAVNFTLLVTGWDPFKPAGT